MRELLTEEEFKKSAVLTNENPFSGSVASDDPFNQTANPSDDPFTANNDDPFA